MRSVTSPRPRVAWPAWRRSPAWALAGALALAALANGLPWLLGPHWAHGTLEVALQWRPASGWYGLDEVLCWLFTLPLAHLLPRAGAALLLAWGAVGLVRRG